MLGDSTGATAVLHSDSVDPIDMKDQHALMAWQGVITVCAQMVKLNFEAEFLQSNVTEFYSIPLLRDCQLTTVSQKSRKTSYLDVMERLVTMSFDRTNVTDKVRNEAFFATKFCSPG